jgi:hypothetical protein
VCLGTGHGHLFVVISLEASAARFPLIWCCKTTQLHGAIRRDSALQ